MYLCYYSCRAVVRNNDAMIIGTETTRCLNPKSFPIEAAILITKLSNRSCFCCLYFTICFYEILLYSFFTFNDLTIFHIKLCLQNEYNTQMPPKNWTNN